MEPMAMRVEGRQRKAAALGCLVVLAGLSRLTMEAGRPLWLVWVLLGGFALRILLSGSRESPGSR